MPMPPVHFVVGVGLSGAVCAIAGAVRRRWLIGLTNRFQTSTVTSRNPATRIAPRIRGSSSDHFIAYLPRRCP